MLGTRLWMGAILIGLTVGALVLDEQMVPWHPFLFVLVLLPMLVGCHELLQLLGPARRPSPWLCYAALATLLAANWLPLLDPWTRIASIFAAVVLAAFVTEMAAFQMPGQSVTRMALTVWIAAYL